MVARFSIDDIRALNLAFDARDQFREKLRLIAGYRKTVSSFIGPTNVTDPTDLTEPKDLLMTVSKILTPRGVASFLTLQKPRAISEGAEPKYSVNIIFDKAAQATTEFRNLQVGVDQALKEKWPAKLPVGIMSPFHDCGDKAGQYEGYKAGDIYIAPWSKIAPGCASTRAKKTLSIGASSTLAG